MNHRRKILQWSLASAAMAALGAARPALAQAKGEYKLKMVALTRTIPQWQLFEFFRDEVQKRSSGRIEITLTTIGELGVQSFDMVRVMSSGLVDIGNVVPLHVSGAVPLLEATELPGLFPDVATNRKAFDAWTEKVLLPHPEKVGGRTLGSFGWAGQMLFSRKPVDDIAKLKGMKIRVTSRSMSDFVAALGGVPVTISLDEMYTGLQQGTVDGATTAAAVGYQQKLYETTKYLVDLDIGTPTGLLVINSGVWAKLPPDLQKVLSDVGREFTDRGWTQSMSLEKTGIEENRQKNVTFQPLKPEWKPAIANAQKLVAQKWGERAGAEGKSAFNSVLAPFVGFKLS